jgi:hypothetical protein
MKIVDHRTFTHDVAIMMPVDDGFAEDVLKTTFNYLSQDRLAELGGDFLAEAVVTFHGLTDDDDEPIACTDELRLKLLRNSNIMHGLTTHYLRAITKVKSGN